MKKTNYRIEPVTDLRDIVLYWQIVRNSDEAILRAAKDLDFLLGYAEGAQLDYVLI
jgi:hypothetical protein